MTTSTEYLLRTDYLLGEAITTTAKIRANLAVLGSAGHEAEINATMSRISELRNVLTFQTDDAYKALGEAERLIRQRVALKHLTGEQS